jgi:membrane protein DedA with SNARE-associated domain
METFVASVVCFVVGFGLGYWLGRRGPIGIQTDYKDSLDQIEALKSKLKGLS